MKSYNTQGMSGTCLLTNISLLKTQDSFKSYMNTRLRKASWLRKQMCKKWIAFRAGKSTENNEMFDRTKRNN